MCRKQPHLYRHARSTSVPLEENPIRKGNHDRRSNHRPRNRRCVLHLPDQQIQPDRPGTPHRSGRGGLVHPGRFRGFALPHDRPDDLPPIPPVLGIPVGLARAHEAGTARHHPVRNRPRHYHRGHYRGRRRRPQAFPRCCTPYRSLPGAHRRDGGRVSRQGHRSRRPHDPPIRIPPQRRNRPGDLRDRPQHR